MDVETAEWVSGPAFVEWFEGQVPDWRLVLTESQKRAIGRMTDHDHAKATLGVVDGICVQAGLHINEIPEEVWTTPPKKGRWTHTPIDKRREALRLLEGGESLNGVAKKYGVTRSTVINWQKRAA